MSSNRLRLNPTKTKFIWFGTRQQLAKIDLGSLAIKYPHFTFSSSVRDLGVTLDQGLTFVRHINRLCRSCYYQIRQLRVVSRSLSPPAASTLVHAFVVSHLDYCSAIYEGLPTCRVKCLDRVLRTAARLVGCIPRFGRVSGYMRDVLHWLPYPQRIVYRISVLVRHCIEGLAPSYLWELRCSTATIQRRISLRSPAQAELLVPRTQTAPSLFCGWSDGLEWSTGCAASDASGKPTRLFFSLVLRPHCLTEVGLGALLSRLP